jgi:signal transduction histidine kinase
LTVRTNAQSTGALLLEVQDTGPGIDAATAEKLFNTFVTTKPHGTGLGLAICQAIVEGHGGKISLVSAKPRGSIFRVALPTKA